LDPNSGPHGLIETISTPDRIAVMKQSTFSLLSPNKKVPALSKKRGKITLKSRLYHPNGMIAQYLKPERDARTRALYRECFKNADQNRSHCDRRNADVTPETQQDGSLKAKPRLYEQGKRMDQISYQKGMLRGQASIIFPQAA